LPVEGQEEIGSPQLPEFLKINREVFACDLILNAGSGHIVKYCIVWTIRSETQSSTED